MEQLSQITKQEPKGHTKFFRSIDNRLIRWMVILFILTLFSIVMGWVMWKDIWWMPIVFIGILLFQGYTQVDDVILTMKQCTAIAKNALLDMQKEGRTNLGEVKPEFCKLVRYEEDFDAYLIGFRVFDEVNYDEDVYVFQVKCANPARGYILQFCPQEEGFTGRGATNLKIKYQPVTVQEWMNILRMGGIK